MQEVIIIINIFLKSIEIVIQLFNLQIKQRESYKNDIMNRDSVNRIFFVHAKSGEI